MAVTDPSLQPGSPAWWDARYHTGDIPWDSGIVPPELRDLAASGLLARGWALDLGCGRGTSSRFLAGQGLRVVGLDLSVAALADARRLAAQSNLPVYFCAGSVADLRFLALQAVLALDIGCFHSLAADQRRSYVASLAARLLPGAYYLLYAHYPRSGAAGGPMGLAPADIGQFAPCFSLRWAQHGLEREHQSAWYLLQRSGFCNP